ncbi:PepSY-associated TM helix domain-containing protein [Rhodovulum euryhalinum]|nr:PepSY-associated TM helix domain-containing protein [Rhodovulum euryhalinum]
MAWLHTWTGLLLGWLLFAVFLTGTIAYFREEVTLWMQPELHGSVPGPNSAALAMQRLADIAPHADNWTIALPSPRSTTIDLLWRKPGEEGGRRSGERAVLDATTGEVLHPRETAGGDFLYRFHFELHGLPRELARWIVGIATMAMFLAILSGVITHKKIFKDFFTFRPHKGQRSWLDMHNMTAVLALPFHVMITFSGLVLFLYTLYPFVIEAPRRGQPPQAAQVQPQQMEAPPGQHGPRMGQVDTAPADLVAIGPLMRVAEERFGRPVGRIAVEKLQSPRPEIVLSARGADSLIAQGGGGGGGGTALRFDGTTGALIGAPPPRELSAVAAVNAALGTLHRARFADTWLRWLFFLSGIGGTVMVGTGLFLWVSKRAAKHARAGRTPSGFRLVERLNVGGVVGLSVAIGAYFWANRLLPVDLTNRADQEIRVFFGVWALACLHAFLRGPARAWPEQLGLAAILFAGMPLLNAATGGGDLVHTILQGNWILAGVDLAALLGGLAFAYAARATATPATARTARPPRAPSRPDDVPGE